MAGQSCEVNRHGRGADGGGSRRGRQDAGEEACGEEEAKHDVPRDVHQSCGDAAGRDPHADRRPPRGAVGARVEAPRGDARGRRHRCDAVRLHNPELAVAGEGVAGVAGEEAEEGQHRQRREDEQRGPSVSERLLGIARDREDGQRGRSVGADLPDIARGQGRCREVELASLRVCSLLLALPISGGVQVVQRLADGGVGGAG
mmetsp:Transcript_75068/g.217883  ORF Transcript_75068/g.217883 Transcript_75068/m.217883 type:complete len:202 (-) Transcript_75068:529-1134(-)